MTSLTGLGLIIYKNVKDSLVSSLALLKEWLALTVIVVLALFVVSYFIVWIVEFIGSLNKKSSSSTQEKDLKQDSTDKILISDRRQIKPPELRLLFLEL